MKHVIYHTDYYDHAGNILRAEEYDANFNTFPDDKEALDRAAQPPIGCRLLLPKLVPSRLSKEQWEALIAKQPDYQLKYASLFDTDEGYAIYAIYERIFEDDYPPEPYLVEVSFEGGNDLRLELCVAPTDYDLGDVHITKWEAIGPNAEDKGISIAASDNPNQDKQVSIYYDHWTILGVWDTMEQVEPRVFVYHCHNALFRFDVTFNLERDSWDGDYESLLHD